MAPSNLSEFTTSSWSPDQLHALWSQLETQITPFSDVLSIGDALWQELDDGAKRWIAVNFMNHVQESVLYCRDGMSCNRYFLGNSRHFIKNNGMIMYSPGLTPFWIVGSSTTVQTAGIMPPTTPSNAEKARRPPNAYILYRKDRHALVKAANPSVTNNEISQILGAAWQRETTQVRSKYQAMALQHKKAHFEKYPNYQYRPRKPSERKRRARRSGPVPPPGAADDESITSPASITETDSFHNDGGDEL